MLRILGEAATQNALNEAIMFPVRSGIWKREEDYLYSSAKEYVIGKKGLVDLELLV